MTLPQIPQIYGGITQLGTKAQAAAVPWWLSGGVSASDVVAAYQPKGATSLAASYVNLANPGTYNAAPGNAPTWDAANGFKFFANSAQYLKTGIIPTSGWSAFVRFSNFFGTGSFGFLFGSVGLGTTRFRVGCNILSERLYGNGSDVTTTIMPASGVMGFAGQQGFLNGSSDGGTIGAWSGTAAEVYIGVRNSGGAAGFFVQAYIQAMAIFNITHPDPLAISAAMAAL